MERTRIGLVGCGYVADFYQATLGNHPELELLGVCDRDAERSRRFSAHYGLESYESLDALLGDERLELLVNLTNPDQHAAVSRAALQAGKHVYSEKPLAVDFQEARALVELAEARGLILASAPCNLLGESAQTLWKAVRERQVGDVRVVYAEMDDGLVHRRNYRDWVSQSGTPWPWKDEFETGCTQEHAGYLLTWLAAFFGPATRVTAFAHTAVEDKQTSEPLAAAPPDFSVACIEFEAGVVARLTCSILAPADRSVRVVGDEGVLRTADCWNYASPVRLHRRSDFGQRLERRIGAGIWLPPISRRVPFARKPAFRIRARGADYMDFSRGVAEAAEAARSCRPCRLGGRFSLHVSELTLAIHAARASAAVHTPTTRFDPIDPMPWAR